MSCRSSTAPIAQALSLMCVVETETWNNGGHPRPAARYVLRVRDNTMRDIFSWIASVRPKVWHGRTGLHTGDR